MPTNVEAFVASLAAHPKYAAKITTLEEAKTFIARLEADDEGFHFDDSPEEIVLVGSGGERFFTPAECVLLRLRVAELYSFDWSVAGHECPIGYALEVSGHVIETEEGEAN